MNTLFLRVRYQVKKTLKSHTNSLSNAIRLCPYLQEKNRLRRRPRGSTRLWHSRQFQAPVQNLFTTISSITCTEHVHNLSSAVPSPVCQRRCKSGGSSPAGWHVQFTQDLTSAAPKSRVQLLWFPAGWSLRQFEHCSSGESSHHLERWCLSALHPPQGA